MLLRWVAWFVAGQPMDGKVPRSQKRNAKERGQKHAEESGNKQPQRKPRHMEKAAMPLLVAGTCRLAPSF